MANTYSAGIVTAYGAAVRGGYTGTYEEFCAQQAAFAENAEQVAEDRAAVEQIKTTFENQTVPAAVQQVNQAGAAQVQAVQAAGDAEERDIAAAGAAQETRVLQAGADQEDAVNAAGSTQVQAVQTAGAAQVTAVQGAGSTQVAAVNAAGATQVDAVEDKGAEVLASIPQDYSALSGDVDDLKSALDEAIEDFAVPTQEAVDNWLTAHPEATTTVQDGSLTEVKLADSLKLKTIKDYVTPEMFGAKGDGSTDDSAAINASIQYGITNHIPIVLISDYYCASTITINAGGAGFQFDGKGHTITSSAATGISVDDTTYAKSELSNIRIVGTNSLNVGLEIERTFDLVAENIVIENFGEKGIYVVRGYEFRLNKCFIKNNKDTLTYGLYIATSDGIYSDIVIVNVMVSICDLGINQLSDIHAWDYYNPTIFASSVFYTNVGSPARSQISNVYIDTKRIGFLCQTPYYAPCVSQCVYIWPKKSDSETGYWQNIPSELYVLYVNDTQTYKVFKSPFNGIVINVANEVSQIATLYFSNIGTDVWLSKETLLIPEVVSARSNDVLNMPFHRYTYTAPASSNAAYSFSYYRETVIGDNVHVEFKFKCASTPDGLSIFAMNTKNSVSTGISAVVAETDEWLNAAITMKGIYCGPSSVLFSNAPTVNKWYIGSFDYARLRS